MARVRILLWAVAVAAVAWSGWWWLGSSAKRAAIEGWLENRRAAGWVAETGTLGVTGFPARFDTVMEDLRLSDPRAGWSWQADRFQILALAYKPNHVIAVWPGPQEIATRAGRAVLEAERWRGSVVFVPNTTLALDRMQVEIEDLVASGADVPTLRAERLRLATRRAEADPGGAGPANGHDLFFGVEAADIPEALRARLDPLGTLDAEISALRIDLTAGFDRPLDRHAMEGGPPAMTTLVLREAAIVWGELRLSAEGRVEIDEAGLPVGEIAILAENWRRMLEVAVEAGLVPRERRETLENGLRLAATLSGGAERLQVTLRLTGGQVFLGPVPLGPAPRFPPPRPAPG